MVAFVFSCIWIEGRGIVMGFLIILFLQIFSKRRLPSSSNMIPLCLSGMVALASYYRFNLNCEGMVHFEWEVTKYQILLFFGIFFSTILIVIEVVASKFKRIQTKVER
jgi:hypothetical protein